LSFSIITLYIIVFIFNLQLFCIYLFDCY